MVVSLPSDGEILRSPFPGVLLVCDACGYHLAYLRRYHGRALCRNCIANEVVYGGSR